MHAHGSHMNINGGNPFFAAAENAIAAQRSTHVRKRGMKKTATTALVASPEEALMIARKCWILPYRPSSAQSVVHRTHPIGRLAHYDEVSPNARHRQPGPFPALPA